MYLCDFCTSPYRTEIETAIRQREVKERIIDRYWHKIYPDPGKRIKRESFRIKLYSHIKHMAKTSQVPVVVAPHPGIPTTRATLENFAQRLLEIGSDLIDRRPEEVKIPDVIQAQRLLVERSRVKVQEDSLRLAVAKMFGGVGPGPAEPIEAIEAVEEPTIPSLPEGGSPDARTLEGPESGTGV